MIIRPFMAAALLAACAATAQAAPVFADNFDANGLGTNITPIGWAVANGTVDIIGQASSGTFYDLLPGHGVYIDLDGSSSNAGELSIDVLLTGGVSYLATFQLAGSQRTPDDETVDVTFGDTLGTYSLPSAAAFTGYSLAFTPTSTGTYRLTFANQGGDNYGALLDQVSVAAAVPEPDAVALVLASLGLVGLVTRRQRQRA